MQASSPRYLVEDIPSFLEFLWHHWGLDFSAYNEASVKRRLRRTMVGLRQENLHQLQEYLSQRPNGRSLFIERFMVQITELFREPESLRSLSQVVFPGWQEREEVQILMMGCSSGEEVLSLAIMLREQGLLNRCRITACDIDEMALRRAQKPSVSRSDLPQAQQAYRQAGGRFYLDHYYTTVSSRAYFDPQLLENVNFQPADLVHFLPDRSYDLIWCKNLLIYFDPAYQNHLIGHLHSCLAPRGILALGERESVNFYEDHRRLHPLSELHRLYQSKR
jgi:chemotaxis protein methyltransferase CheR